MGAALALGAVIVLVIAIAASGGGKGGSTPHPAGSSKGAGAGAGSQARLSVSIAQTGRLQAPVQDAAAVAVSPTSFLLLGGIDQSESSRADIVSASASQARTIGTLPTALHDASASFLGGSAYLFGGGVVESFSQITRVNPSGVSAPAGNLPTPGSDVAAAAIGETAYIVGGYTGSEPLRTILAWRPGQAARVVATLPKPLRYAAVANVDGKLLIAGGTSGEAASADIYSFDPAGDTLSQVGRLPVAVTHAAAAAIDGRMLLFGGRGASKDSQTSRILAISPAGHAEVVGALPRALSDLAAVTLGEKVALAGGRDSSGRLSDGIFTVSIF